MGIVIDFTVISFILLSIFYGYKKGLVKVGIRLVSFLIAIVITFVLYKPISMIIENTTIDEIIQNTLIDKIDTKDKSNNEYIENRILGDAKSNLVTEIAKPLSYNIIYTVVMILLFVISKIILFLISSLTDILTKLPIINQFNKFGGILYGIVISFFIIYLILLLISFVCKYDSGNQIYNIINNTYITRLLYEYNIFNLFFM